MIERDLELALQDLAETHVRQEAPADVREDARLVPLTTSLRRSWLPGSTVRFQSMFSATKFVVAGAIVALFGGYLLIAQPFDQREASVPGAASEEATQREDAASAVSGEWVDHYYYHGTFPDVRVELPLLDGMVTRERSEGNGPGGRMEMSDERLSGDVSIDAVHNHDGWDRNPEDDEWVGLWWGTIRIENDGGTWEGTHFDVETPKGALVMQLTGTGDYEGLSAILYQVFEREGGVGLNGLIFPGDLPPDRE